MQDHQTKRLIPRTEIVSALVGLVAGSILAGAIAWQCIDVPTIWIAGICGGVLGLVGGATGQNLLEGIVAAVICAIGVWWMLTGSFTSGFKWVQEPGTGAFVGIGVGWLAHGLVGSWELPAVPRD